MEHQNKKVLIVAALAIVIVGAGFARVSFVRANFLNDFWHGLFPGATSGIPAESTAPAQLYQPVEAYEASVTTAVKNTSPAVVSITISKNLPVIEQCPANPYSDLPPQFQQFFGGNNRQQFTEPCQKGTKLQEVGGGSGFVVSPNGLI